MIELYSHAGRFPGCVRDREDAVLPGCYPIGEGRAPHRVWNKERGHAFDEDLVDEAGDSSLASSVRFPPRPPHATQVSRRASSRGNRPGPRGPPLRHVLGVSSIFPAYRPALLPADDGPVHAGTVTRWGRRHAAHPTSTRSGSETSKTSTSACRSGFLSASASPARH